MTSPSDTVTLDSTLGEPPTDGSPPAGARRLARGDSVGRFVLLSMLGEGGMGVVWAAHDAELDRKVAIKLLHVDSTELGSSLGRTRLVREAQALAKLSHPHVVTVHDVGTIDDRVWVAMEYVEGRTLKQWLGERERSWREVLTVFRAAGLGLAAAHAKGIVHRDFKPDNVMVGDDGRVRVMDFGLARAGESKALEPERASSANVANLLESELTVAGSVMGTPAYMSPEQHLGLVVDAASDQFSFCVAVWEALHGERPFPGDHLAAIALAVTAGTRRAPTRGRRVPSGLKRALDRGLAIEASARFPDMQALLQALDIEPRRRRVGWAAGLVVVGLGLSAWTLTRPEPVAPEPMCTDMSAAMDSSWRPDRAAAIEQALTKGDSDYARANAARVKDRLEVYANEWVAARQDACEATHVRGDQSGELLDRRMACLDQHLDHFRSVVEVLAGADDKTAAKAMDLALGLPDLDSCADTEALLAAAPPPRDAPTAEAVEGLRATLARVRVLETAARYDEALAQVVDAAKIAETLDYPPIRDSVAIAHSGVLERLGRYDEADPLARRAYDAALGRGDLRLAQQAASQLVSLDLRAAKYDEGRWWANQADGLARAIGDTVARAQALKRLGMIQSTQAEFDEAAATLEQAMALIVEARGDDDAVVPQILTNLGGVYHRKGDYDQAIATYKLALARFEVVYGGDHPTIAVTYTNLGGSLQAAGQLDAARAALQQGIDGYVRMFGPDHPELAGPLMNLGIVERDAGELEASLALCDRALAVWTKALGESHPNLGFAEQNRARTLRSLGRLDEAARAADHAAQLWETTHGEDYPLLVWVWAEQAEIALLTGAPDRAAERFEKALQLALRDDPNSIDALVMHVGVSRAARAGGRDAVARDHARAALVLADARPASDPPGPATRFALAQALWDAEGSSDSDHDAAVRLVEAGLADPELGAAESASMRAWLQTHATIASGR